MAYHALKARAALENLSRGPPPDEVEGDAIRSRIESQESVETTPATEGQYHSPNDAPEHIRHQLAAAAFAKQKIGELLCPDAEDVPVFFFDDRYAPCHSDDRDEFLEHNERLCTSGAKVLGLWKTNTYRLLNEIESGRKKDEEEDEKIALRRTFSFQAVLRWFFSGRFSTLVPELLSGKGISDLLSCLDDESLPSLWKRCRINIRPLPCTNPDDAGKKLEVQFLRFNDGDPLFGDSLYEVGGRLDDDYDDDKGSESERGDSPGTAAAGSKSTRIRSGDVRDLLLLQFHLHTVRHRLEARGTLQSLFGGPPPPPDTIAGATAAAPVSGSREDVDVNVDDDDVTHEPDFDESLVAEAVRRGLVSEADGSRWGARGGARGTRAERGRGRGRRGGGRGREGTKIPLGQNRQGNGIMARGPRNALKIHQHLHPPCLPTPTPTTNPTNVQCPLPPAHSDDDNEQSHEPAATPVDYSQQEINRDDDMERFIESAMTPNASRDATMSEETGWSLILGFRQLALEERKEEEANTSGEESATSEEEEEEDEEKEEGGPKKPVSQSPATDDTSCWFEQISGLVKPPSPEKPAPKGKENQMRSRAKRQAQKLSQAHEARLSMSTHIN
ncbi:uncharacterized protein PG986_003760 [Apiospora aurea]|uniref:HNH nuclease domain-containing protein n=1 Tax=Apiospora aurea TaxID=335848 RepID=A0ABR1QSS7_9PEZI